MKQIALATCAAWPELIDDDRLLIPALRKSDVSAVPVVWDAPLDWTQFDEVVIRSCWDYHLRLAEFLEWISNLERSGVQVQNSPRLIRWNADKRYLRELNVHGALIPPTVWLEDKEEAEVYEILRNQGWDDAVLKPTVGASAHQLNRVFQKDGVMSVKGPALLQAFVPEIISSGETSLVFIGGEYSHAVVKLAKEGDFRVQSEFGGQTTLAHPEQRTVQVAKQILSSLPAAPLYARIDGVERRDGFVHQVGAAASSGKLSKLRSLGSRLKTEK